MFLPNFSLDMGAKLTITMERKSSNLTTKILEVPLILRSVISPKDVRTYRTMLETFA